MIAKQRCTHDHHNNNDSGDIDDDGDVSRIVESLDLDFSRLEGQEDRDELCYEDVGIESNDPEQVPRTLTDKIVAIMEDIVFLQSGKNMYKI